MFVYAIRLTTIVTREWASHCLELVNLNDVYPSIERRVASSMPRIPLSAQRRQSRGLPGKPPKMGLSLNLGVILGVYEIG